MIRGLSRLFRQGVPASTSHTIEPATAVDLVLFTGEAPAGMVREFAVWCARRVWHLVEDTSYDYDPTAHGRFVHAVETAERYARGAASAREVRVAWESSIDPRARSGWGPGRLAAVGAFKSAALMSARFACRTTCAAAVVEAARRTSSHAAWAVGYLAAAQHPASKALSEHLGVEQGRRDADWRRGWEIAFNTSQKLADEAMRAGEAEHASELRRWLGR